MELRAGITKVLEGLMMTDQFSARMIRPRWLRSTCLRQDPEYRKPSTMFNPAFSDAKEGRKR